MDIEKQRDNLEEKPRIRSASKEPCRLIATSTHSFDDNLVSWERTRILFSTFRTNYFACERY